MHTPQPTAVTTAVSPAAAALAAPGGPTAVATAAVTPSATASSTSAAPTSANALLHLDAHDMGTPADVTAELDLIHTANRDMFSWLLFNSENMSAPGSGAGGLDDPFRILGGHDDIASSLPLSFLPHATPVTAANTAPTTTGALPSHAHHPTTPALASGGGQATATAAAGSLQVSVQMGTGSSSAERLAAAAAAAAAAAKRRGKKRASDSPLASARTTPTSAGAAASAVPGAATTTPAAKKQQLTGKENLNGTPMSATQAGLLRHLESANMALAQKRQSASVSVATIASASATPSYSSGLSTPKMERASSSGSDDTLTTLQRKQKLERNRESARECRRRKREHILGVEERCRQLERENMELRGQLKAGKEAMKQEEKEKNRVCEELEQMIQRGASEKELAEKIDNFKEQYSDYGHGRRSALSYHLHQIERLLLPTQVTKMCIWALRQDDSFWQDEEDETSLPVILAKELGLTEEQKKKIQQQRCVCDYVMMRVTRVDCRC